MLRFNFLKKQRKCVSRGGGEKGVRGVALNMTGINNTNKFYFEYFV